MDTKDVNLLFQEKQKKIVMIYNPLGFDVDWTFNGQKQEKIPSREIVKLDFHKARVASSLIIDLYVSTKDKNYSRKEAEKLVLPND
jgi:hypothetical protein